MRKYLIATVGILGLAFGCHVLSTSANAGGKDKKEPAKGSDAKIDKLATATAEGFMKAVWKQDIDAVMKTVDLPFFFDGVENLKDRDVLKRKMERLINRDRSKIEYKLKIQFRFKDFSPKLTKKSRTLLKDVVADNDRVVVFSVSVSDDLIGVFTRVRGGKASVVGFRD
ncbi:MAG: hypothetical protein HYX68_26395 [Planctomycetes bacterium]|nr:hypothetical protein [Planctomycetota bacterium]